MDPVAGIAHMQQSAFGSAMLAFPASRRQSLHCSRCILILRSVRSRIEVSKKLRVHSSPTSFVRCGNAEIFRASSRSSKDPEEQAPDLFNSAKKWNVAAVVGLLVSDLITVYCRRLKGLTWHKIVDLELTQGPLMAR